ncbi:MAG: hypothetical protein LWX51_07030 [Deltaproteobacteria bacterium]|nr:hypothetical protein [Deltaproteobacteria bacterium]
MAASPLYPSGLVCQPQSGGQTGIGVLGDYLCDAPGRDLAVHPYATVNVVSHDAKCLRSGTDSIRLREKP